MDFFRNAFNNTNKPCGVELRTAFLLNQSSYNVLEELMKMMGSSSRLWSTSSLINPSSSWYSMPRLSPKSPGLRFGCRWFDFWVYRCRRY